LLEKKKRTVAEADGVDSGADATFAAGGEGGASKNEQQGGGGEEANTLITGAATILGEMTCSRATVGASNTQHHHDDGSILQSSGAVDATAAGAVNTTSAAREEEGGEHNKANSITGTTTTTTTTTTTIEATPRETTFQSILHSNNDCNDDNQSASSSSSSAIGHLMNDVTCALHDTRKLNKHRHLHGNSPSLQSAYIAIRQASMQAIGSSLVVYSLTAVGIALNTRGLDEKVIAIIVGASQFMGAIVVFIVSAKVPQWIGVYHQGAIRLVKCSSNYSQQFEQININDQENLRKLRSKVRLGVWFHFSKFYIILMPFYCGVREITIPLSIVSGAVIGFILMWAVFVVHEKYIHHRNIVSFTTILLLSIISSLTFTRGMAWMQFVWNLNILSNADTLMVISFFTWLVLCAAVHTLFLWHTLRTDESSEGGINQTEEEEEEDIDIIHGENNEGLLVEVSRHGSSGRNTPKKGKNRTMRRISSCESYASFVFDPRTHFKDGKCQFSDHPDLEDDFTNESTDAGLPLATDCVVDGDGQEDFLFIETPVGVAADNGNVVMDFEDDEMDNACPNNSIEADPINPTQTTNTPSQIDHVAKKKGRPACCEVFICFSPEYQQSSCLWKIICWIKIIIMTLSYLLCLYFVIVSIGATHQIANTRSNLPAVQEALYNHMNEGPVCAFDNRGSNSSITTFEDKEAANKAGFLVVHCGACGACSSWENLIIEYTTRDNMAALANACAKTALFGGGDDALAECLMDPKIGFEEECAICWMDDILCTQDHCAFIFLQSQMINNVGNFAVGEGEVTSATCEEAHCEVGQFVPCSGATRRRMNIVSSISRPGDQQCGIVDVESWEDLFFGSGVA